MTPPRLSRDAPQALLEIHLERQGNDHELGAVDSSY